MTSEFFPIRTQADIDQFLDRTNGLHDGYLIGVQYIHGGHSGGNPQVIDPDCSELRLHWLVTSIQDAVVELCFTAPRKWQLRDEGFDITDTSVSLEPDGTVIWADDLSTEPLARESGSYVIAKAMKWRFLQPHAHTSLPESRRENIMFESIQKYFAEQRAASQHKKEEQERLAQEERERILAEETARIAEEQARIQEEHDRLMAMTEKELLVEAVMALRGLYSRTEKLEADLEHLGIGLAHVHSELQNLEDRVRSLEKSSSN